MSVKCFCEECEVEMSRVTVVFGEEKYRLNITGNIDGRLEHQQPPVDICINCTIKLLREKQ